MGAPVEVFHDPDNSWCICCDGSPDWPDAEDNDCFLCGADHSPLNGEANYFCRAHLDRDAVIVGKVATAHDEQHVREPTDATP